jgi:hypothetical protein
MYRSVCLSGAAFALLLAALPSPAQDVKPAAWQKEWKKFGEVVDRLIKGKADSTTINQELKSKYVEWVGTVEKIEVPPPSKPGTINKGVLLIRMEPIKVSLPDGGALTVTHLGLDPYNDDEWKKWATVKAGTRVAFRTRLIGEDVFPAVFVLEVKGKKDLIIRTYGVEFLKEVPK